MPPNGVIINHYAPTHTAWQGPSPQAQGTTPPASKTSAGVVRRWQRRRLRRFIRETLAWLANRVGDPPQLGLLGTTGLGKSESVRQVIVQLFVPEAKRLGLPHRCLIAVPTHRLASEARDKMPNGVSVAIYQGRGGKHVDTGEPMCRRYDTAVKDALKIGANVEESCCKGKFTQCPLLPDCHYHGQKTAAHEADVVYAAHEVLFQVTEPIGEGFGLVVIDEGFWQDGLNVKPTWRLAIEGLATELRDFPVVDHGGRALVSDTDHLRTLIEQVQRAFSQMPDGEVLRKPLLDQGLIQSGQPLNFNVPSCVAAVKMEWDRKIKDVGLRPDTSDTDREKLVAKFGFFGQLQRRIHMWRLIDELISGPNPASGRLRIETVDDGSGPVRYLRLLERKEIVAGLDKLPLIVADATLPADIVREFLPKLSIAGGHPVDTPYQRISQVLTRMGVGKSGLQPLPPGTRTPEEEDRVANKRKRLIDVCRHLFEGRRGLVITYKGIEDEFRAAGLEVAHFGAIEGIDRWKDVGVLVIIGRTLPRPEDIRDLAVAISGQPVPPDDSIEQRRSISLRNGRAWPLHCLTYPTAEAEMVRTAVTEAGLVQAIGRARGVNRAAGGEVEVFLVANDVVIPGLEVDAVQLFEDMEPNAVDEMWLRGLVLEWASDAAKVWPKLFKAGSAARVAYHRAIKRNGLFAVASYGVTFPYNNILIRRCNAVSRICVRFQPDGPKQIPRHCIADPAKISDVRAVLEKALGRKLVKFEIV